VELDFPISIPVQVGDKHTVLCFCFLKLMIRPGREDTRPSVFPEIKLGQENRPLDS
jgi:hypothetical protein